MDRCEHVESSDLSLMPEEAVCKECVESGDTWVSLRVCKECGHVGCCDSSKNRHARAHHARTKHPIMGPAEGGEWLWCYEHDAYVEPDGSLGR